MSVIDELIVRITADMSDLQKNMSRVGSDVEKGMKPVNKSMRDVGKSMESVGTTMSTHVSLPLAAMGTAMVMTGANFDQAMSKVQAVTGATGKDMEALREQAKELGSTTKFSASEAAEAMGFLGMAGFETNQIMESMPGLLDLAATGALDLGRAADIASNIMSGFGMEAEDMGHISDVLAKAATSANTSVEQMGSAMSYVAPIAKGMGISMEETAAAVGVLSDAGIQGERAGTALRGAIAQLAEPTGQTAKTLEKFGLSAEDVNPKTKSLAEIIETLSDAGVEASDAMSLVGVEAGPGLAVLLEKGADGLNEFTGELENAEGAAAEMAEIMGDNAAGKFKEFQSALEGLALAFWETAAPAVIEFTEFITSLVRAFSDLPEGVKIAIMVIGGIATAIGPMLLVVGKLIQAFAFVKATFLALKPALAALSGPIGWIILAIIAVGAALVLAYKRSETFREIVNRAWEMVKEGAQALWEFLQPLIMQLVDFVIEKFQQFKDFIVPIMEEVGAFVLEKFQQIRDWWDENGAQMLEAIQNIFKGIWAIIEPIINLIVELFRTAWPTIKNILANAWDAMKQIIEGALDVIMGIVEVFITLFTGDWEGLWEAVKRILRGAGDILIGLLKVSIFGTLWTILKGWVKKGIDKITDFKDGVVDAFKTAKDKAVGAFEGLWGGIKKIINLVISGWNTMIGGLNSGVGVVNKIPGVNVPTVPKIPALAEGGIVTAPTLAMVGEGRDHEAVLPLNDQVFGKLAQGIADQMGGGGARELVIKVMLDGRQILPDIRRELHGDMVAAIKGVR